jgi:hypothetical protein
LLAGIIGVGARFGVFSGAACVPLLDMIIATISIVSAAGQGALPLAGGYTSAILRIFSQRRGC